MPPVSLQVGERHFCTSEDTLTGESEVLKDLLLGKSSDKQSDGPIFIDRDGDLFVHILRYLRTNTYPLFHDNLKGHDEALYRRVFYEAEYFAIDKLKDYLDKNRYRQAIRCTKRVNVTESPYPTSAYSPLPSFECMNGEIIELSPHVHTRKVYICPRGIAVHMDNEGACGRQCSNARGANPYEHRTEIKIVQVYTRTELQEEVLNSNHSRQEVSPEL